MSLKQKFILANPTDREVRKSVFDYTHGNEHLTTAVFLNSVPPEVSSSDVSHLTQKNDIYSAAGSLMIQNSRVLLVEEDGSMSIFPPHPDPDLNQELLLGAMQAGLNATQTRPSTVLSA